jgi:hypothetical protein
MSLEAGSFIGDLVPTNPDGADSKGEGDNHIRLLKTALQGTFPGMAGRSWRSQTKSVGYTVVANDNMSVLNVNAAAVTIAFTAAATLGNGHMCMVHANGFDATLDPNGAELVNGAATLVIPNGFCAVVLCDGSAFKAFMLSTLATWTTGDVKVSFKTAADIGWVPMNDGTIGDGSSGASTRANADTEALFTLLWNNTVNADCAVSTGRGANAAVDFAAHKTIALPKALGRNIAVSGTGSGLTARALASVIGVETITTTHLPVSGLSIPSLSVSASGAVPGPGPDSTVYSGNWTGEGLKQGFAAGGVDSGSSGTSATASVSGSTGTGTTGNMGSGNQFLNPRFHANVFMKL